MLLIVHGAIACEEGEVVEALYSDNTYRLATIVEVRKGYGGMCGSYRLSWHHAGICDDTTTEYWGDDMKTHEFCIVGRNSIKECKRDDCTMKDTTSSNELGESSGTGSKNNESNRAVAPLAALAFFSIACCCICLRLSVRQCLQPPEVDVEQGIDAATPKSLWALTPKSTHSSTMARWVDKTLRAAGPSHKNKKVVIQPEAPVVAQVPFNRNLAVAASEFRASTSRESVEQKHAQRHAQRSAQRAWLRRLNDASSEDLPGCPPDTFQTQGSALRQAARDYAGPVAPPLQSDFRPPPLPSFLPTLLTHTPNPSKQSPPRKKAPLQGLPPQEPTMVSSRKGPSKYGTRNQALGIEAFK